MFFQEQRTINMRDIIMKKINIVGCRVNGVQYIVTLINDNVFSYNCTHPYSHSTQ